MRKLAKDFDAALKIRPESKLAKAGLERADAGIKREVSALIYGARRTVFQEPSFAFL